LRAGRLRHRVELQSVTRTQDGYGEADESWSTYTTVWAAIEPLRGQERYLAQQVNSDTEIKVVVRYNSSVDSEDRVLIGSRVLEVVGVINPGERDEYLELLCREIT